VVKETLAGTCYTVIITRLIIWGRASRLRVGGATSRKAREVAHPQIDSVEVQGDILSYTPLVDVAHPPRQMTSSNAIISAMRTTVALDDDLVRIAQEFTGVAEKTALIREALKALIERESARRLASLEGTMPKLKNIPRRRPGTKTN